MTSTKYVTAAYGFVNKKGEKKMTFYNWQFNFTTWTVWTAGLLVKDTIKLIFKDDNMRGFVFVDVVVNYSARGYGRMIIEPHNWLDGRMFDKHRKYMDDVDAYRNGRIMPVLEALKGKEFKSVNAFIKEYNKRAYVYYG